MRPEMREIIKRLPKLRGHGKNRARTVNAERVLPVVVNVSALEAVFENGAEVTPATLVLLGVVGREKGKAPRVKILGSGDIKKKLTIKGCLISLSARAKVEGAGGSIV
jgi:large subunit ribosomal protein L15